VPEKSKLVELQQLVVEGKTFDGAPFAIESQTGQAAVEGGQSSYTLRRFSPARVARLHMFCRVVLHLDIR
jgi:hypothetical protein